MNQCTCIFAVNVTELNCEDTEDEMSEGRDEDGEDNTDELGTGDVDPDDTRVCGTDANTYPGVCQMLQRTANVNVRHAGKCNASVCRGGPVSRAVPVYSYITVHCLEYN